LLLQIHNQRCEVRGKSYKRSKLDSLSLKSIAYI
jgi:hypothetical protein